MTSWPFRAYRRLRFGRPIVVVSGLPRSGTSMAMRMLEEGGMTVFSDGVRTADEDNPKGYFEYERVKDLAQEPDKGWLRGARGQVVKVISYLLKELPPHNNYKVVFLRRNLHEVIASQNKMLERRGEEKATEDARMIELYEDHLWKVDYLTRHAAHLDRLDIDYRAVIDDASGQARRVRDFLGLDLDLEKMAGAVDRSLYRNRA